MNISFFGASVTKQKEGMSSVFTRLNPNYNITSHGYGGMFLKDAGICYIDNVIKTKPDYCFIDWFSPQLKKGDEDVLEQCLDAIVYKLLEVKCVPILLLLYRYDIIKPDYKTITQRRLDYYQKVRDYALKNNIPIIDTTALVEQSINKDDLIRDSVHTTPNGSELYGKFIHDQFHRIQLQELDIIKPQPNKFCSIKQLTINQKTNIGLDIIGNCTVIGIEQKIGPYSGIVSVNDEVLQLFDHYCYYERHTILLSFNVLDRTGIRIVDKEFDRSIAKQQLNWNDYKSMLNILSVFYVGEIESIDIL